MESKQKEQTRNELEQDELERVNGGVVVPVEPEHDDDGNSNNNGGGATGGW